MVVVDVVGQLILNQLCIIKVLAKKSWEEVQILKIVGAKFKIIMLLILSVVF